MADCKTRLCRNSSLSRRPKASDRCGDGSADCRSRAVARGGQARRRRRGFARAPLASRVLRTESRYQWLYERVWAVAQECNRRFFCVDIAGVEANIQLARYDSSDQGFYDWHTDFAGYRPLRKLSVSIQLSGPKTTKAAISSSSTSRSRLSSTGAAAASSYSRASRCIASRPSRAVRAGASSPGSWATAGADARLRPARLAARVRTTETRSLAFRCT